jgi:hypothetical protein
MLAALALLFAAFSSLATSAEHCPQVVSLFDTATVVPGVPAMQHYTASGGALSLLVRGQSAEASEVRVRLEPDDPTRFHALPDAGPNQAAALTLQPGVESTAALALPGCFRDCDQVGFSVIFEHVAGAAAALSWEVFAETSSCAGEFDVRIDRR